jgi:hypothetical protein
MSAQELFQSFVDAMPKSSGFFASAFFGAAVGAAASVALERLVQRFERKVCISIRQGVSFGIERDAFTFTVTNCGLSEIPPSRFALFGSKMGTMFMFPKRTDRNHHDDGWDAGQEEEFEWTYFLKGKPHLWLSQEVSNYEPEEIDGSDLTFRLVQTKSRRILYDNPVMGKEIARIALAMPQQEVTPPAPNRPHGGMTTPRYDHSKLRDSPKGFGAKIRSFILKRRGIDLKDTILAKA